MTLADIPTPALLVDVAALDRNIATMARFFSEGSCRLRPHFKAHKTPDIARRQLAAGSCVGLTCATVSEAEIAATFCDDILIANEIIGADKCERVAALAAGAGLHGSRNITIAIDSEEGLKQIANASGAAQIGILIDINVGQNRCGVAPGGDALALAARVAAAKGVRLRGVMGYEGHLQPIPDRADRAHKAAAAMNELVATAVDRASSGAIVIAAEPTVGALRAHIARGYVLVRGRVVAEARSGDELDRAYKAAIGVGAGASGH